MTKRRLMVFVAAASFLFAAACTTEQTHTSSPANANSPAQAASTSTPDPFAAVRVRFEKDCKECHGQNGQGGPVKLEDGTKLKVPTLREGNALRHADADFEKQITKGGDGMPAFADKLKPEEIKELIQFIRREFQGGAATPAAK